MSSMLKLLPLGLAVVLLAGCGSGSAERQSGAASAPATGILDSPPTAGGPDSPPPGGLDAPPTDAGTGNPTPRGPSATVPGACGLITRADLVNVTKGTVTLLFVDDPSEDTHVEVATGAGATSTCRQPLRSKFTHQGSIATLDGAVVVRVQSSGANDYFPVRAEDHHVAGIGDDAMNRNGRLYVRLGTGMLILDVGIANPSADSATVQFGWAKTLAATAISRI